MSRASSLGMPAGYAAGLQATEAAHRELLTAFVAGRGGSPELVAHVASRNGYLRVAHFLTEWIADRTTRAEVAAALTHDIMAMKLLDDLMDDDTGLDRTELACLCVQLHLAAVRELGRLSREPHAVADQLERDFTTVYTGQIRAKRDRATDLVQWCTHAHTYGATFLGCYGTLAARCARLPESVEPARTFAESFGVLITVADDLTDYDRDGEREGNLAHLIRTGAVAGREVVALLEGHRERALRAVRARPATRALVPVVEFFADDVLVRQLPQHTGDSA